MTRRAEELVAEAMHLSVEERAQVVAHLLNTLEGDAADHVDESWRNEVRHRRNEYAKGEIMMEPWEHVEAELLAEDNQGGWQP